jgi:hypothetical protein
LCIHLLDDNSLLPLHSLVKRNPPCTRCQTPLAQNSEGVRH